MDCKQLKCLSKVPISRKAIVLLFWVRSKTALFSRLSHNITREVYCYHVALDLVWIYKDKLTNLNPRTLQWDSPVLLVDTVPVANASWVLIGEDRVMLCGGSLNRLSISKTAYEISCNGNVRRINDMLYDRARCGMVVWKQVLHVFGSFIYNVGEDKTCESLSLPINSTSAWTYIGSMAKPRALFTPVVWKDSVFLCGGSPSNKTIEVYDGHFALLSELKEGEGTVCFVKEESLLILTGRYYSVLSVEEGRYVVKSKVRTSSPVLTYAGMLLDSNVIVALFNQQILLHSATDGNYLN